MGDQLSFHFNVHGGVDWHLHGLTEAEAASLEKAEEAGEILRPLYRRFVAPRQLRRCPRPQGDAEFDKAVEDHFDGFKCGDFDDIPY